MGILRISGGCERARKKGSSWAAVRRCARAPAAGGPPPRRRPRTAPCRCRSAGRTRGRKSPARRWAPSPRPRRAPALCFCEGLGRAGGGRRVVVKGREKEEVCLFRVWGRERGKDCAASKGGGRWEGGGAGRAGGWCVFVFVGGGAARAVRMKSFLGPAFRPPSTVRPPTCGRAKRYRRCSVVRSRPTSVMGAPRPCLAPAPRGCCRRRGREDEHRRVSD